MAAARDVIHFSPCFPAHDGVLVDGDEQWFWCPFWCRWSIRPIRCRCGEQLNETPSPSTGTELSMSKVPLVNRRTSWAGAEIRSPSPTSSKSCHSPARMSASLAGRPSIRTSSPVTATGCSSSPKHPARGPRPEETRASKPVASRGVGGSCAFLQSRLHRGWVFLAAFLEKGLSETDCSRRSSPNLIV